jgi:uncharacterized protein YjbJ (UPF0337 family)
MRGRTDIAKGRVEEAAGVLSGNEKLREKGKGHQKVGRIKRAATKVVDKMAERLHK